MHRLCSIGRLVRALLYQDWTMLHACCHAERNQRSDNSVASLGMSAYLSGVSCSASIRSSTKACVTRWYSSATASNSESLPVLPASSLRCVIAFFCILQLLDHALRLPF